MSKSKRKSSSNINDEVYDVEKIIGHRRGPSGEDFLVKWVGYRETTWEPKSNIPSALIRDFWRRAGGSSSAEAVSNRPPPVTTIQKKGKRAKKRRKTADPIVDDSEDTQSNHESDFEEVKESSCEEDSPDGSEDGDEIRSDVDSDVDESGDEIEVCRVSSDSEDAEDDSYASDSEEEVVDLAHLAPRRFDREWQALSTPARRMDKDPVHILPEHMRNVVLTPLSIFDCFIGEEQVLNIVDNTNSYASLKSAESRQRGWSPVTASEMYVFIATLIYMGLVRLPAQRDYWAKSQGWPSHICSSYISRTRFETIKAYLKISDPIVEMRAADADIGRARGRRRHAGEDFDDGDDVKDAIPPGYDCWYRKVQPLFDHVERNSRRLMRPGSHVAVDEMMVRFVGRSIDTYRLSNKPIPKGYKLIAACLSNGYMFSCIPVSRSRKHGAPTFDGLSATGAIVAKLAEAVAGGQLPAERDDLVIWMDNYYTSTDLLIFLRENNIAACGTAKRNSIDRSARTFVENAPWGTIATYATAPEGVLHVAWVDNGIVALMTTHHQGAETTMRNRRRPRKTSTNAARVRAVFGEEPRKQLPIPLIIDEYNAHMGSVDIADQFRSYYGTLVRSRRNWWPLWLFILDRATINSYVISKGTGVAMDQKQWRMNLVMQLFNRSEDIGARTRDTKKGGKVRKIKYFTKKTGSTPGLLPASRLAPEPHTPKYVQNFKRKRCFWCRYSGLRHNAAPKTNCYCSYCNVYLCKDVCYEQFHNP